MRKIYLLGSALFLSLSSLNAQSSLRVIEGVGTRLYDINDSGNALHPSGYYDYATNTSTPIETGAQSTAKINNSTNVAGVMPFVAEDGSNIDQAAYKKNGVWTGIGYFLGDVPESGWFAGASAISENSKYVTGLISTGVSGALPFIFDTETSTLTKLTGDNLYEAGRGYGINDSGIIAAWIDRDDIFNTGTFRVPAYFDAEGMVHYIDFDTPEYGESNDVNNAGQVVGYKSNKAFIYDINTGIYQSFTAPDGSDAVFTSISDNGMAIGYSSDLGTRDVIIYHPSLGDAPVFLKDLLIAEGVTITTFDGKLGTGMGISPDGKFICGFDNTGPIFFAAGWVVYLDIDTTIEEGCLDAENGQYPSGAAFVPACNGAPETITSAAWTGEYSMVTVTSGVEYIFSVSDPTYFITIGNEAGDAIITSGSGSVTWTANLDGEIRFYTHFNSDCEWDAETFLSRTVQCGEVPPPPATCEDQKVLSNNLENGLFFGGDTEQSLAVDVIVGDTGFTVYGVDLNVFTDGNLDLTFNVRFFEDDGGLPGTTVHATTTASINSSELVGNAFGYDVYNYVIDFATDVNLDANTIYWMQVESDGLAWEATSTGIIGSGLVFNNTNVGVWTNDPATDLVYSLVCSELGVSDMNSFDFAYYPNPVKDELNITSQKVVQSVSVYNLAGQQISTQKLNVNNGKVSTSALAPGVYVFRAVLDGGQVETFKVIKK